MADGAARFLPAARDLDALREAAAGCRGCELHRDATQTVFGAGPGNARLLIVGEQPGDSEDKRGRPFVGPAGGLLDRALLAAGIDRDDVWLTNAVKHFKFKVAADSRRRLHDKPDRSEVAACKPWLLAEIAAVEPELVVCLGATAAQDLLGGDFRVTKRRGEILTMEKPKGLRVMATVHPSAVLRTPGDRREEAFDALVADLSIAARELSAA
ncbi:UdgX family uracil-DNA binding protein [Phytomonospora endophytica]|uniref:Type-4 uracil-DNA glycosylase n=1 Tax=Phytomonospora endophytica TaxID=714109 RepID=A0A841FKK8_9ACTN|nr:UdgX family uracil-DNA binding protein [Phytomonospora endophytica]MBB6033179.1 DNA polymerase [Phytomonospora endophytica]GIG65406.1 uracil-DNA glycosylase [Phytomonospora endophytica]